MMTLSKGHVFLIPSPFVASWFHLRSVETSLLRSFTAPISRELLRRLEILVLSATKYFGTFWRQF